MITHNHAPYIAQAIESVLAQVTTFDVELVIGEDASLDDTRRIVQDYHRRYPDRIRLLLPPRSLGARANIQATMKACRGKYVALLEGDDFWIDPGKLQAQVELLDANPAAFICGARALVWKEGAATPSVTTPDQDSAELKSFGAREMFEGRWWFRTCTKMFPRHVLQQVPAKFGSLDWHGTMWLIAATNFGQVCFLDRPVGVYREHPGGAWSSLPRYDQSANDIRTLYDLIPVFDGAERAFLRRVMADHMSELLKSPEMSKSERIVCACLSAIRTPRELASWRRLASSIGLALRRPESPRGGSGLVG